MIVNPQFFNYRLTIGVLLVAISALALFSYMRFADLESENDFLNDEKKIIQNEIVKVISSNNKLEKENKLLNEEIESYKQVILTSSDSIKNLKSNTKRLVYNYERLISDIQSKDNPLQNITSNEMLNPEDLNDNSDSSVKDKVLQNTQYNVVKSEIDKFSEIAKNSTIVLKESFKARAYRVKKGETKISTSKASRTNNIEVCFTLSNNALLEKDTINELYIQIIDPNNNVVSDKGAKKFNDLSLIYSLKTKPVSDYDGINICEYVYSNEKLTKGIYFINIFDEYTQLASTKLELY